jgi:ACS family probable galactarate transporter
VISDTAPKEIVGLCGGVFNVFGNVASIVTPLVFVGCSALMAMVCYLFVVGDIKRMELQK